MPVAKVCEPGGGSSTSPFGTGGARSSSPLGAGSTSLGGPFASARSLDASLPPLPVKAHQEMDLEPELRTSFEALAFYRLQIP
mmetsp:Transcript_65848/g.186100  ORF Transcript_65848/g.186100 Transcript_65848/m.186100 type:complete len:83 (+) Transcript_65848:93-341(+)